MAPKPLTTPWSAIVKAKGSDSKAGSSNGVEDKSSNPPSMNGDSPRVGSAAKAASPAEAKRPSPVDAAEAAAKSPAAGREAPKEKDAPQEKSAPAAAEKSSPNSEGSSPSQSTTASEVRHPRIRTLPCVVVLLLTPSFPSPCSVALSSMASPRTFPAFLMAQTSRTAPPQLSRPERLAPRNQRGRCPPPLCPLPPWWRAAWPGHPSETPRSRCRRRSSGSSRW